MLIFLAYLEIPVKITQHWGSARIFNDSDCGFRSKFTNIIGDNCWSTNHLYLNQYLPMLSINLTFFLAFVTLVLSPKFKFYITSRNSCTSALVITVALLFDYLWFKHNYLLLCGDVKLNPGPTQNTAKKLSSCHWNLNSIVARTLQSWSILKRIAQLISLI